MGARILSIGWRILVIALYTTGVATLPADVVTIGGILSALGDGFARLLVGVVGVVAILLLLSPEIRERVLPRPKHYARSDEPLESALSGRDEPPIARSGAIGALSDLYREGREAMQECQTVPAGPVAELAEWRLFGGTPQEQIVRETHAREWDERVLHELWAHDDTKHFAPSWTETEPQPPPPARRPDESKTNPDGLAHFYRTKLALLHSIIKQLRER